MKNLYVVLFFSFAGFQTNAQTTVIDSIFHDGLWRNYRLYIPAIYTGTTSVPLVLNLHGYTSNAIEQEWYGDFRPIADTANFIIVHPNGTGPTTAQYWNAYTFGAPDDIGFLEALIDTISLDYNINSNRVYTCGMSNGGIMSYFLACNLNYKFAAIGSVTGSMTNPNLAACVPPDNIPVIEIHGTADGTVPYNGSGTFAPIDSIINFWAEFNNCNMSPVVINYPNINTTDGCTADEYAYLNGTDGSETVLVKVTGGGHTWPGAPVTIGVTNRDFEASNRLWEFFMKFDKSQFIGVNENSIDSEYLKVYPNPFSQRINLQVDRTGNSAIISDISGRIMMTIPINNLRQEIDLSKLSNGVYVILYNQQSLKLIKN